MPLLRRSPITSLLFLLPLLSLAFLLSTILYGTRTEHPVLPPLVKEILPAGRCACEYSVDFQCDTCLACAENLDKGVQIGVGGGNGTEEGDGEEWKWVYEKDRDNYGLSDQQCDAAFPGLFEEIERARKTRVGEGEGEGKGKIKAEELRGFDLTKGMVRGMVWEGKLSILETHLVDNVNRQKALGVLASLHRSLISSPSSFSTPNIEFLLSVEDLPAQPSRPVWQLARRPQDTALWLIPDFGFWAWDKPHLGALDDVARASARRDALLPWESKHEKLVWRGKISFAPKLRHGLVDAARGKTWSDVGGVVWGEDHPNDDNDDNNNNNNNNNATDTEQADNASKKQEENPGFISPLSQCSYKFIAHAEGRSYSGSLKYRQLCRSVVLAHKLQWIQHHHPLLRAEGPHQNFVEVERDWSDLEEKMEWLLEDDDWARGIAERSVRVFREKYLTGAAEACYWRRLVRRWGEVGGWDVEGLVGAEGKEGDGEGEEKEEGEMRGVRWERFMLFEPERQLFFPKSA